MFQDTSNSLVVGKPFFRRLQEEKYRARRYKSPLSLVTVSLEGWIGRERNLLYRGMGEFIPWRRSSDIMGWCAQDHMGLILPGTDPVEAWKVKTRLRNHLQGNRRLNGHRGGLDNGMISVMEAEGLPWDDPCGLNGKHRAPEPFNNNRPDGGLLWQLQEERNRSDRNSRPFAVVLLSLERMETENQRRILDSIQLFSYSKRLSDTWGWYARNRLALILPETNEEGARTVTARLLNHLQGTEAVDSGNQGSFESRLSIQEYPKMLKTNVSLNRKENGTAGRELYEQICSGRHGREKALRRRLDQWARRLLDLAVVLCGAPFASPVMLLVALLVKLTSKGPALFRQLRVGRHGKTFTFLKFRTMHHNCDPSPHREYVTRFIRNQAEPHRINGCEYYKLVDDPRVTPLGRFLRRTALDELPQLFNVLKGEMSLVGPRPPIDYEVRKYQTWQLRRVLEVKPGITGFWQVFGRSTTTFDQQVRLDLKYVRCQSLFVNLWILFKTVRVVLLRQGGF